MAGKTNPSLVSLFSGAGGMDIGFEKAGFKTIWANEYDKTITPSYRNYFQNTPLDERSICDISDTDIPNSSIGVISGPPCQSWSEAGAKRGISDPRGALFFQYLRVIQKTQPLRNAYKMIGNAVPVNLAFFIAKKIKEDLEL